MTDTEYNTPCSSCGSTTTPLHTNGKCGNCYDPSQHQDHSLDHLIYDGMAYEKDGKIIGSVRP